MKKGLLICSGGMSSSAIAKKLTELSDGKVVFRAIGLNYGGDTDTEIPGNDIVLISPQIRFQAQQIEKHTKELDIPTYNIKPNEYITTQAAKLLENVMEVIK